MNGLLVRMRSAVTRVSTDPHLMADALFAALVGVVTIASALSPDEQAGAAGADTFAYITIAIGLASLLLRRHLPLTVLVIVTTVLAVFYLRDGGEFLQFLGLSAFYAAAAHSDQRRRAVVALLSCGAILFVVASFSLLDVDALDHCVAVDAVVICTSDSGEELGGYNDGGAAGMVMSLTGAIALGMFVRNRQRLSADAEQRAATAEADRLASTARAVADERSRIAREMHDVVAHGMSVIAVQAAAAQEIVHTDPDKAAEVMGRIENVGRQSLNEMRRMLGVLRNGDDSTASLTPQPTLADVPGAVEQATEAGVATNLVVRGDVRDLPPGIELAAFRVVQEALTNVLKHAGPTAGATVTIEYRTDDVVIDISDNGRGAVSGLSDAGGGNGLIGMGERVEVYGGSLAAGPRTGGGYAIRVVLPTDESGPRSTVTPAGRPSAAIER